MPFPESPRVLYERNPLAQVICQLRFPPILRIDSEVPAAFQDRVRHVYPLFRQEAFPSLGPEVPAQIADLLVAGLPAGVRVTKYEFISEDDRWTASLTKDFLALTSRTYDRWESFKQHLGIPLDALRDLYAPAFYSRVGLRYQDLIRRSGLGLSDVEWSELLRPQVLGELASPELSQEIEHVAREVVLRLHDGADRVRLKHGFIRVEDPEEVCYQIDADFFTEERTDNEHVYHVLDRFNQQAGRLFRWCITERLHDAMGPKPIE